MELACPDCGKVRNIRPATVARLKTAVCRDCIAAKRKAARITLRCPHCGVERAVKASDAAKRAGQSCRSCPVYSPTAMPDTYDAGYVLGVILGDGSLIVDVKRDGRAGYYLQLVVTDRAFAEKFCLHVAACVGRKPWMKSYIVSRGGNPEIGMPPTTVTQWNVKAGSRAWYDMLVPYKKGREFGGILSKSDGFRRGFIQGIFDSEGYRFPGGGTRSAPYCDIAGKDVALLETTKTVLESLGERAHIFGPYPYSRGVAHLRTTAGLTKTTEATAAVGP